MTTTTPRGVRVVVELDQEAAIALDLVRRDERLSRPNFARAVLVRHLRETGALASASAEAAR